MHVPDTIPFMGKGPAYSLVVVRADGTRTILTTGIPESNALRMRQALEAENLGTTLILESEADKAIPPSQALPGGNVVFPDLKSRRGPGEDLTSGR